MSAVRRRSAFSLPGRRVIVVNSRKLLLVAAALIFLGIFAALSLLRSEGGEAEAPIPPTAMDFSQLGRYFRAQLETGESWDMLAALEEARSGKAKAQGSETLAALAALISPGDTPEEKLSMVKPGERKRALKILPRYSSIAAIAEGKGFPFEPGVDYDYGDTWGNSRDFGGERTHEGTDMFAAYGERIVSVSGGVIEKLGWNRLGGWRVGVRSADGVYYYYAHMSEYADGLAEGQAVERGDLLGYVGDSGYGPEGTTGMFEPHLHFGMYWGYGESETAFNAYPYLCLWDTENNRHASDER